METRNKLTVPRSKDVIKSGESTKLLLPEQAKVSCDPFPVHPSIRVPNKLQSSNHQLPWYVASCSHTRPTWHWGWRGREGLSRMHLGTEKGKKKKKKKTCSLVAFKAVSGTWHHKHLPKFRIIKKTSTTGQAYGVSRAEPPQAALQDIAENLCSR
ncbi:hypothetical protein LY78DRAFT_411295 [Colletotrichum sublineola]|nr:hypothetical protein LY78DRAFT_411295 [Colletotrichum sublineola]